MISDRLLLIIGFSVGLIALALCIALGVSRFSETPIQMSSPVPRWNMLHPVPDSTSAVMAALAAWIPKYGSEIFSEMPFRVELIGDTLWLVEGTLPEGMFGGVAGARILKRNGCILATYHGK